MYPSDGSEESIGAYLNFDDEDTDKILGVESGRPNQDGQIATGTSIGGTRQQQPITFNVSKKRRRTRLDDEEKKERKKIADKKYRAKAKTSLTNMKDENEALKSEVEHLKSANDSYAQKFEDVATQNEKLQKDKERLKENFKDIQSQLQAANSKIERRDGAFELLNEEKNLNAQKLQAAATEIGKLQYENNGLKDHVRKLEEELRGLKGINASLMEGNVTMTNDLQRRALQHKIYFRSVLQRSVNMFGPNHIQGFPMQQEQLGQEDNGRLGFEGDGAMEVLLLGH